jgi:hypothetical protein
MYTLKVNPVCSLRVRKTSKLNVFKGNGEVVLTNAYDSFSNRLDSIDAKLLKIESFLNIEHTPEPIFKEITEDSTFITPSTEDSTFIHQYTKNVKKNPQIVDLEAQLAEATSEARRNALQQRIKQLS